MPHIYTRSNPRKSRGIFPVIILAFLVQLSSCSSVPDPINAHIEVLPKFTDLQRIIDQEKDKLFVINFWATSCPPCLKEMPHFSHLQEEYGSDNVRVLLVSLDDTATLESRVYPFVEKYHITPEVTLLQDQNYSDWTDEIDPTWYGALPATIMLKGNERSFRFGSYKTYEELKADVESLLK